MRSTTAASIAIHAGLVCVVQADVNVEFRVLNPNPVVVGDEVDVGLFLTSDDPGANALVSAVELVFEWEVASMEFIGLDDSGGVLLGFQGFIAAGSNGLNEADPPADGDGLYYAFAQFGAPIVATPSGTLLTTFVFQTTDIDPDAHVVLPDFAGDPPRPTVVFDGVIPNTDITGSLGSVSIEIRSDCGPADCDQNGVLNVDDIDCFVSGFLSGNLEVADCDGNSTLNVDDIDCFVASFLFGCN
ncbi:MAG: hypothetical protein RIB32_01550 [Phycisphaerales bacterium]